MWSKIHLIIFYLCAPGLLLAQEAHFSGFGGINNQDDSMLIADSDAQSAMNVITDEGDLRTIPGNMLFTVVSSSSISFHKEFFDSSGNRRLFVLSGTTLSVSGTDGTFSTVKTFASLPNLDIVSAFGKAYFTDGSAAPFYSDGSSSGTATGMEDCKYTELYQTRLACVNMSTDTSKVRFSAYNDPASWSVTASVDSGAIKYLSKDDGYPINCVFTMPEGLFVGKANSTAILKGSDNETFYWVYLSNDVGCVDDRTVQMVDGELVWLSQNGFYAYDFDKPPRPISHKIKKDTDNIKVSNSVDSNWTFNTQAAWETGTGAGWDATVSPGNIKTKTFASYGTMFVNSGFEEGNGNAYTPAFPLMAAGEGYCGVSPVGAYCGCKAFGDIQYSLNPRISILNASDLATIVATTTLAQQTWTDFSVSGSGDIIIKLIGTKGDIFTSPAFDRGLPVSIYTHAYGGQNFWTGECFDTKEVKVPVGVSSSTLSTSTYLTNVHFVGNNIAQWKTFNVSDVEVGATPSFYVRTSSESFTYDSSTPAWISQNKNETVSASTGAYVQIKIEPNVTTSTQSVNIISMNTVYTVGTTAPRAASVVDDHRYICAASTTSDTQNDIVFIWQRNKEWTYSNVGYGSLGLYNNRPLAGSNTTSSKLWYIMDPTMYSFDGTAIDFYWETKDYTLGSINNHKVLDRLWINAENNGVNNFGVAWQANRDGVYNSTTTSLSATSFIIREVDGLFESQYPSRQVRFKFSGSELNKYFRLKIFSLYYHTNPLIKD